MGYPAKDALEAVEKCGLQAEITELQDYIYASQMEKEHDDQFQEPSDKDGIFADICPRPPHDDLPSRGKRKLCDNKVSQMIGFGVPDHPCYVERVLPKSALVPPYQDHAAKDMKVAILVDMGYPAKDALEAVEKCGLQAEITELTDYIYAAQMEEEHDVQFQEPSDEDEIFADICPVPRYHDLPSPSRGKRKLCNNRVSQMIGFGVPDHPCYVERVLPKAARGKPYFYYENVALAPKGSWKKISSFLDEIEPEFVDSNYFCVAARKRGYVHNLPIRNRFPLSPKPPCTIQEAFTDSKEFWPSWDPRTQLNCLLTVVSGAKLTEDIWKRLESCPGDIPTKEVQDYVLAKCRKWNLIWVGRNKVAPLEPKEMEMILGYPKNHTRGGTTRLDRHKALGNSFQIDTVAYHLSVLKKEFPDGMNVLSLFSGIGGAEVALHRLGIPLNNVVSVESSEVNRNILRSWWQQTNQRGTLIEIVDIQHITIDMVGQWIKDFGGFDLVIGGSPCNNLAGGNRVSRNGLDGELSSLFHNYHQILHFVRIMMDR
ncbi:C-5 cytosine methyltransferase [Corchorus olitorius]|uniref:DNA (cytosine-5-)-methyltransferase n=1 Tax=Corchorus olitorius TaxID=93759 RepID=A0A1R3IC68_9ROSI|nr:C-5 cytosine methyltransferase [Corchorus olitorius]